VTWLRCAQNRNEVLKIIDLALPELPPGINLEGTLLLTLYSDFAYIEVAPFFRTHVS